MNKWSSSFLPSQVNFVSFLSFIESYSEPFGWYSPSQLSKWNYCCNPNRIAQLATLQPANSFQNVKTGSNYDVDFTRDWTVLTFNCTFKLITGRVLKKLWMSRNQIFASEWMNNTFQVGWSTKKLGNMISHIQLIFLIEEKLLKTLKTKHCKKNLISLELE